MSRAVPPSAQRPYGLVRVTRVWRVARSTAYLRRSSALKLAEPARKRGPRGGFSDEALLVEIRQVLADSPWVGEGHRKPGRSCASRARADRVLSAPVRLAIATHSHYDRTGGLGAIEANGIRVLVLDSTAVRLPEQALTGQVETFHDFRRLEHPGANIELFAPGPGHALDNIVVWLPDTKLLYGGCFVKSADAKTLGNIADADLARWPASIQRVVALYGGAKVVVPGHGDLGGPELLTHTLKLVKRGR